MPKHIVRLPDKPADYVEPKIDDRIIRNVCFFGDSSIDENTDLYNQVRDTARHLAENGYAIVNGGGPGVMKAATDGAKDAHGHTVAIYWQPKLASIFEGQNLENTTDESQAYSNYMMRTMGLIEKGHVYVVCKGGTGTVSEFGMVWALAKLYYGKHKPVILFGEFWKDIIDTIQHNLLIDDNELQVLNYATTKEEVLALIQSFEVEVAARAHKTYTGDETSFVLAPRFDDATLHKMKQIRAKQNLVVRNTITNNQLNEFLELVKPPARVLEIGAGLGVDTAFLAEHYSVTAVDNDQNMVEMARLQNPNADILFADIRDYEIQENVFKGIWSRDALHHLNGSELPPVFGKLAKGLVPGGVLYFIVRAGSGEGLELDVHAGKQIERFYHYFSETEVQTLAAQSGLQIVKMDRSTRSHEWLAVVMQKPA
jgi:uncharacterized protein (TIGR00725 family)